MAILKESGKVGRPRKGNVVRKKTRAKVTRDGSSSDGETEQRKQVTSTGGSRTSNIDDLFQVSFLLFRLFPSGVATVDLPSPFGPMFCILLRHFSHYHVLSHLIHKPPFRPSLFPLSWQLHPQHPSPNIPIIFPLYMYKPPQSCLSCVLSKTVPPVLSV